jgi:hypothetical protein
MCRESDGVDWYDYIRNEGPFEPGSVKFMSIWRAEAKGYIVGPAVYRADMLCPSDHIVSEIVDYEGHDPQADFGSKLYDLETQTFHSWSWPLPEPPQSREMQELEQLKERVAALERKMRDG